MSRPRSLTRLSAVLSAALLLVLATACSSGSPQPAAGGSAGGSGDQIKLVTSEWKFEPASLKVPVGKPVTLVLENKGALEHDVYNEALGVHLVAPPRETVRQTITFDKPGTYEFDCSIAGHKESGMKGTILVGN
jgi:cytochrome c oxidase subunit 2